LRTPSVLPGFCKAQGDGDFAHGKGNGKQRNERQVEPKSTGKARQLHVIGLAHLSNAASGHATRRRAYNGVF
jgi:hypothetical protein